MALSYVNKPNDMYVITYLESHGSCDIYIDYSTRAIIYTMGNNAQVVGHYILQATSSTYGGNVTVTPLTSASSLTLTGQTLNLHIESTSSYQTSIYCIYLGSATPNNPPRKQIVVTP